MEETQQISITLTTETLEKIDQAAKEMGVKRQDLIRIWIADKIKLLVGNKESVEKYLTSEEKC